MAIIKMTAFKCDSCGYEWTSRIFDAKNPPTACARCKSAYWNKKPKKRGMVKKEAA